MALRKRALKTTLESALKNLYLRLSSKATIEGEESKNPKDIISELSDELSTIISDAVDEYIRTGDIYVTNDNLTVIAPNGNCTITTMKPLNMV